MNGNWFVLGIALIIFVAGFVTVWKSVNNRKGIFEGTFGKLCRQHVWLKVLMSVVCSYVFVIVSFLVLVLAACDIRFG